jgi:hypothetical protein
MDDPASGRVPQGGSEEPTQAYYKYVEESDSDSAASWKEASCKDAATTKVYA